MVMAREHEYVAELEARVAELERLLEKRSDELRSIQRHLDVHGLLLVTRIVNGLPPLPAPHHDLERWQETTELHPAHVKESMHDLWRSLGGDPSKVAGS